MNDEPERKPAGADDRIDRIFTIPNLICVIRILGSLVLVGLAIGGRDRPFLWLFVALAMSDWIDGKLAILLNQRSRIGPHHDMAQPEPAKRTSLCV